MKPQDDRAAKKSNVIASHIEKLNIQEKEGETPVVLCLGQSTSGVTYLIYKVP